MISGAITANRRSFLSELGKRCSPQMARLHWTVIQSAGLLPGDTLYAPIELAIFQTIASRSGIQQALREDKASIIFLYHPVEAELLAIVSKLEMGRRVIAYNDDRQIETYPMKSFEALTACLFDPDAKKAVRFFDGGETPKVDEYIHLELSEHNDPSLAIQASRIASLR